MGIVRHLMGSGSHTSFNGWWNSSTTEEIHVISTAEFPQHNPLPSPNVKHRLVVDFNTSTSFRGCLMLGI